MRTELAVTNPDEFYTELVRLHQGLAIEDSLKLNAKLILLLANEVGDARVLADVLAAAARDVRQTE